MFGYSYNRSQSMGVATEKDTDKGGVVQEKRPPPEEEIPSKCLHSTYDFCTDFTNDDLDGWDFFALDPINPLILKTNLSKKKH